LESVWSYWEAPGAVPEDAPGWDPNARINKLEPGTRLKIAPRQHRQCTNTGFSSRYRHAGGWLPGRPIRGCPPAPGGVAGPAGGARHEQDAPAASHQRAYSGR
jgi:hypothetical protein